MAKFRNIAVISTMDAVGNDDNHFDMHDFYGNRNNDEVEQIQEVEETLYGEENSNVDNMNGDEDAAISQMNNKKNMNFDPEVPHHRK